MQSCAQTERQMGRAFKQTASLVDKEATAFEIVHMQRPYSNVIRIEPRHLPETVVADLYAIRIVIQ